MIDHLIFLFYLYIFLFSTLGYGLQFSKLINNNLIDLNLGWYGLIGFFLISLISVITSFIIPHDFMHNFIIHLIGLIFFCNFFHKSKKKEEYKLFIYLSFFLLIGAYVFKNHDDFSYYHLTYALNLSENSFIVGTGNFSHGFRTFSSLFYYHSTLFLPFIDHYLFHIGPFYILIFFNYVLIYRLIKNSSFYSNDVIFYYSLISLIFINIVFYRIGEHGTDRSAQVLLILIFLLFIEIINLKKNNKLILTYISLLTILISMAASMKAIYYLYFILLPIIFYKNKLFSELIKKQNSLIIFLISLSIFLNLSIYYLNTGCFLYPAEKTCVFESEWSIPKDEVKKMSIHYEWWAKAGGGPGYSHELDKKEYIKNFIWFENWIEKHFFNKVSDTLLGTILICFIVYFSFFYFKKNKKNYKKNKNYLAYLILLIFFIEWFLNHPSMRYGGYVLVGLPIILFTSEMMLGLKILKKNISKLTIFFIILSIVIFNVRNLVRIDKEIRVYGYKPLQSPFFLVEDVNSSVVTNNGQFKIFAPIDNNCWASKTPCSYNTNLKLKNYLWMHMVSRN